MKQSFALIRRRGFLLCLLLLIYCSTSFATAAPSTLGPPISQVTTNATTVERYEKFEITFDIATTTATTLDLPYDPNPPPGVTPGTGITVEALFSNDNWATTILQPAFLYQAYSRSQRNGLDHIYPTGQPVWQVRFAPRQTGRWRYRLRATDAAGTTLYPAQGDLEFTVISSNRPGFLRVSPTDPRYFEFDNGTPFIGIGHQDSFETDAGGLALSTYIADEKLARFERTRTNFIRTWLSSTSVAGSAWAPWTSHVRDSYGNVPYITLSAAQTYAADGLSLLLTPYDACVFQGFQGGSVPVQPNTTYRLTARVKTVDVNAPAKKNQPYGFTIKLGGWLGETGSNSNPLLCDDPNQGAPLLPHISGNTDWQEVTATFKTDPGQYFLPNFYLVLDNAKVTNNPATEGKVYIDEVRLQEVQPAGQVGPNVVKKANMSMHRYFDPAPAWQWDYILDRAAEAGVYLKLVVLDKDDLLYSRIGPDGIFNPNFADEDNSFAQAGSRVRWLHEAWWRYLIARWGYSPAVHSWELFNEGDPYNENHYRHAEAMAEYFDQHDPNRHMVTTSFWSDYPVSDFWDNPAYDNIDYADVHAYVSTGEGAYAFWGDGFEPPLAIETNPAHTLGGGGWSIRLPGSQPFEYANKVGIWINGQGEWLLRYQMKAENLSGSCDDLSGPRLYWELKSPDDELEAYQQVPPAPNGDQTGCSAPAGTYGWTEFASNRLTSGQPAPSQARLLLSDQTWHLLTFEFRNDAVEGGTAWIDNIELINPAGQSVPLNGEFDLSPMSEDAAWYTASRSLRDGALSPIGPGKPLVRGEAGLDYPGRQEEQADLAQDQAGIWFHNFVWGQINPGGMYDLYWWTGRIWANDLHDHVKPFQDFMDGIPLANGRYRDAAATASDPSLRLWGQKDPLPSRFHLWIQNREHTWRNVVDNQPIPAVTGTITVPNLAPGPYAIEWWDTYAGTILHTEMVTATGQLTLTLPQPLTTDIAVKGRNLRVIASLESSYLPVIYK